MGITTQRKEEIALTESKQTTVSQTERTARFEGIGWKVRLQLRRTNHVLTLAKEIALGNGLKRGDEIFYYLVESQGRKALLVYLDGQERPKDNTLLLNGITFLVKK